MAALRPSPIPVAFCDRQRPGTREKQKKVAPSSQPGAAILAGAMGRGSPARAAELHAPWAQGQRAADRPLGFARPWGKSWVQHWVTSPALQVQPQNASTALARRSSSGTCRSLGPHTHLHSSQR